MEWWVWLIIIFIVLGAIGSNKEKEEKKKANNETLKRRKEAEDYIMSSGDPEAIKMLMLARANPANYGQVLAGGMNKGNDTLKMALGVMTGVVAGNLISTAITASAIESALGDMQAELSTIDFESLDGSGIAEADFDVDDGGSFFDNI